MNRNTAWHDGYEIAREAARTMADDELDKRSRWASDIAYRTEMDYHQGQAAALRDERQDRNRATAKANGLLS